MLLKLVNNLTHLTINLDNLQPNLNSSDLFYAFTVSLPENVPDGEYTYTLYDDSYALVRGLATVGDYEQERTTYNNENQTIVYGG